MCVLEPVSDRTTRYSRAFQPVVWTPPAIEKRTVCSGAGHFGRSVARQAALKKQKQISAWGPGRKSIRPYPAPPCAETENAFKSRLLCAQFFYCSAAFVLKPE